MSPATKIVDARARVLRARVTDGIEMSFAALPYRSMVLVEVETSDGAIGYGESWINFPAWGPTERMATLREGVFPLVVGQDARNITTIHCHLLRALLPLGRQWGAIGPVMQSISAVDIALWDLHGRRQHLPISDILGGRVRQEVAVYASSIGPRDVAEQARAARDAGHRAAKLKVGFGRPVDERNLATAREELGADMKLYVDANQAWTLDEAVQMAPALQDAGALWVEEPIAGNRLGDLEAFHQATRLPIATGENLYGRQAFVEYLVSPSVAVLQPDIAKTGGISEMHAICQMAMACGKQVIPHHYGGAVSFAASLQIAALCPAVSMLEYDIRNNPLRDPLLANPPRAAEGYLRIPESPGLGMELDIDAVDRTTLNLVEVANL